MDFAPFDERGYPVVSAQTGYGEWADHYEATVVAGLDRPLLQSLESVDRKNVNSAVDLACGTGRTGLWLSQHGVRLIDGVDFTEEMLAWLIKAHLSALATRRRNRHGSRFFELRSVHIGPCGRAFRRAQTPFTGKPRACSPRADISFWSATIRSAL